MVRICDLGPCYKKNPVNPKSCCANLENVQTKGIVSQAQKLSPVVNKCKIEILNRTPHNNLFGIKNLSCVLEELQCVNFQCDNAFQKIL